MLRDGGRTIAATTGSQPTSGLVVYDLRTCLHGDRGAGAEEEAQRDRKPKEGPNEKAHSARRPRRARDLGLAPLCGAVGPAGTSGVSYADGSSVVLEPGSAGFERLASIARAALRAVTHDELGALLVERALLEGDFVLRSGRRSSWYLDKYRFETEPEILRALGERLAERGARARAGRRPARRTGPRSRRVGSFGSDGVRSALHHRAR